MTWLLLLALLGQGAGFAPLDVSALAVAPPMRLSTIDMKALKGEPRRLAWSGDGLVLYLQTVDGRGQAATLRHYGVDVTGGQLRSLRQEPAWAGDYWAQKVNDTAPGFPTLRIDVALDQQKTRVAPFVGGFVNGGAPSGTEAASTISQQRVTLRVLGVEIGQWMTDEEKSGATFGWGPIGSGALAFVDRAGHVALLDKERRQRIVGSHDASHPAWSPDGGYVAFLQRASRTRYELVLVALARTDTTLDH